MSSDTTSTKDTGGLNKGHVHRDIAREQQIEGHIQAEENEGEMLVDDDPQPNPARGLGDDYRAGPDAPDIGEPGSGKDIP